ncbi:hypothetical protein EC957_010845 [Mortierella hygrophila]|uniref:FAD-binding domain-containing protein n=1 Tax=Mortierella hygrophila TaxID=979708 RepID=A0A9P6K465_9FUNG|nr:hypothetical protein EC957_010845 [Mortierella hygrophila]
MTAEHQQQQHQQQHTSKVNDTVLIVGASIAGMMQALLWKAGIPYDSYERAAEVRALGSALCFNATTAQIFKFGSKGYIISRAMLYDVLRRQVHKERFHMDRRVVSISQKNDIDQGNNEGKGGVTVEFQDGSTVRGGILVGADGAYSAVRQNMYAQLKEKNLSPASDDVPLPISL